jgi:D-arabinose 1-dehydrogenase-like Zn-dependent alcohol dehydrogenase
MNELEESQGKPLQHSLRLTRIGAPLEAADGPLPEPAGTEVLLRVHACGVCHSDLHLAEGFFDLGQGQRLDLSKGMPLPLTLGHEIAGEVVSWGAGAEGVQAGQRRVVYGWVGCDDCPSCRRGVEQHCDRPRALGVCRDGGFSNYVLVPHPRYLFDFGKVPQNFAATLGCSGLTAYGALRKAAPITHDQPLLIIGAGGVGQAAISIARAMFGEGPVVADIDPAKREAALAAGARMAVDPTDKELRRRLLRETDGGFAAAIDFVGMGATAEFGLSTVRKGGKLIVVGLFGGALTIALPTLPLRGVSVVGSYVGSLDEMGQLMALARSGVIAPTRIETRPLTQAQATLDDLRQGRIRGRAVLLP